MKIAWFHKPSTREDPSETLAERVQRLEAGLRQLNMEWEDTYERMHRLMARVNKRYRDFHAAEDAAEEKRQDAPGGTISNGSGLDPISAAIHARRSRAVPPRANGSEG